ncbi:phage tail tape measure protein [Timonella senegalensis]|uniref:phage tail tape measure protein n=1 Tax=Timonella senegalensis TaxID=1465825 RepID=UPI000312DE68|nr:phage tail tape measure protein [Timonella senegalensis]
MADRSIKLKLEAEVSQYKKELDAAAKVTEKLAANSELAAKNVAVAAAKQKTAASQVAAAEQALQKAQNSGKASATQLAKAEQEVMEAKRGHWKASQELKAAQEGLTRANLAQAESALKQQSAWKKGAAFFKENRTEIDAVGSSLTRVGTVGVATLGLMTKGAMSWESAWAGVTKTVNGTEKEMASLETGLRGLTKVLPSTHEEIAGVAESAGALGVATKDILGFTRTMVDLGETTNLTSDEAATQIAQISNVMGTMARDGTAGVERFGSTLVALGNDGASTEADILALAQRIAGAGKTLNATEADVLAVANTLASMGINAELGGGVTSRVLLKMRSAVDTGGKSLEAFARTAGLSADEFATKFRTAPMEALDLIAKGIHNVNTAGGNVTDTMKKMGIKGTEETQVMLALANSGNLLTDSLNLGATAWEQNSALAEEAAKRYETTEAKVAMAWNAVKDGAIEVGQYVLPIVAEVADGVADLAGWFANLPEPVKATVTALGGIASVTALAAGGALKLAGSVADSYTAFKQLTLQSPKLASAIKGIGTASVLAAPAIMAVIAALSYDGGAPTQSVNELNTSIRQLGEGAYATDTIFKDSVFEDGFEMDFDGFIDGLSRAKNAGDHFADFWRNMRHATLGDGSRDGLQVAVDNFRAFDEAMASATATSLPEVAKAFESLNMELDGTEASGIKLLEQMPGLRDSLIGIANETGGATDNASLYKLMMSQLAGATGEVMVATDGAVSSTQQMVVDLQAQADAADRAHQELLDLANGVLSLRDANRGFEAAIDSASDAIAKNGKNLDISTAKGRENQAALDSIASSGLAMVDSAREQGASQEELEKKMSKVRKAYIAAAENAGMSTSAAKKLADQLGLIPKETTAKIKAEVSDASAAISGIHNQIVNLPNGKTVTITTNQYTNEVTYRTTKNGPAYKADGGRVSMPALAGGGRLPRTGLGTDQILGMDKSGRPTAWVNDREWVINDKSSDKYDGFLDMINRDDPRVRHLAGLASGGRIDDKTKSYNTAKGKVSSWGRTVKAWEKTVKDAEKAYQNASGKSAKKAAKARLDSAKADLKRAQAKLKAYEKERDQLKKEIADLKATRTDLTSGVAEKSFTYNEKTGQVETSNSLMNQGTGGLSGAYNLVDQVKAASKLPGLTKKQQEAMAKASASARKEFEKLYKEAALLEGKLGKAQQHVSEMASVSNSVKSGLAGGFSLGDSITEEEFVGGLRTQKRGVTGADMVTNARAYSEKLRTFASALKKLADWGLSSTVLQEIAGYGVDDGLMIANSLSRDQVAELNQAYSSIDKYSQQSGQHATRNFTTDDGTFIAGGLAAGEKTVATLEKQIAANEKALATQTDKLLDAWGKPFDIKYDAKTGKMVSITPAKKAFGGFVFGPGTQTSDSIPTMLSNGEFVVRAREAQKPSNSALLRAMNAGKNINPPTAYAGIDYNRLGAAVASAIAANPQQIISNLVMDRQVMATWVGMAQQVAKQRGVRL